MLHLIDGLVSSSLARSTSSSMHAVHSMSRSSLAMVLNSHDAEFTEFESTERDAVEEVAAEFCSVQEILIVACT